MFTWKKLASGKWEDAWVERLSFLGPERLAITSLAGKKSIRIEAYSLTAKEADALVRQFGGKSQKLKDLKLSSASHVARKPIAIRKRLLVVASKSEKKAAEKESPNRIVLAIPAAMAFGTGEHATTAGCLRFLADISEDFADQSWDMLDLGTGSGILAIAARALGAKKVEAHDFDPHAVRTAKENLELNATGGVSIKKADVTKWTPPRQWQVVAANLFSEVLIQSAQTISKATCPGGRLIFSGVLRSQEKETIAAFKKAGFEVDAVSRKGKWIAALATRK
jgi:ribosomal protein L11 methyltransferase